MERLVKEIRGHKMGEMRVSGKELLELVKRGEAVMVDIREPYETDLWGFGFGLRIPISQLPERLGELPKDKLIITACPHKDRSNIACTFLRTKGFNAKYLADGLTGLVEELRGVYAKEFWEAIHGRKWEE
jgi:rhodanese-related sulfurtransferase